jgi:hypothetical protein
MRADNFHYNQGTRYECDVTCCKKHGVSVPDKNGNCIRCEKQKRFDKLNILEQFNGG